MTFKVDKYTKIALKRLQLFLPLESILYAYQVQRGRDALDVLKMWDRHRQAVSEIAVANVSI